MPALRHLIAALLLLAASFSVRAAQSYDNCAGFIDTLPATISTQGVWCLRQDLSTAITSGNAIEIATNNVTIDCNEFKLSGLAAGLDTQASGIHALSRLNATVRHCNIRGFYWGVVLRGVPRVGHPGHLVEDNRFDGNTDAGIIVQGPGSVVRRNHVANTGGCTLVSSDISPPAGIATINVVDILDNTVSGVLPVASPTGAGTYGIYASGNHDGRIDNNRVRGVATWGIYEHDAGAGQIGRIGLDGNHVVGNGGLNSTGIECTDVNTSIAIRNIVNGFQHGINCGGADNVIVPP